MVLAETTALAAGCADGLVNDGDRDSYCVDPVDLGLEKDVAVRFLHVAVQELHMGAIDLREVHANRGLASSAFSRSNGEDHTMAPSRRLVGSLSSAL
jgi:hypothetical protein